MILTGDKKKKQNVAKAENLWLKTSFEPQPKKNKHLTSCDQVASPSPRTWASQKNSQLLEEMSDDFRKILKNIPGFKKKKLALISFGNDGKTCGFFGGKHIFFEEFPLM